MTIDRYGSHSYETNPLTNETVIVIDSYSRFSGQSPLQENIYNHSHDEKNLNE